MELVNFSNGSSLGNSASTDSSFQTAIEYNFSVADTARLGLASNLETKNPFYYKKDIASLSQYKASAGETITINYTGPFASATDEVYIGGKLANNVSNSDSSITVTVPDGTKSGNIEIIYEGEKIIYGRDHFTFTNATPISIASSNYSTPTLLENLNGNNCFRSSKMEVAMLNNDNVFDAMIVSSSYDQVTLVNNLSGVTSLQEFSLFSEGNYFKSV